jgi:hypothetical protein
MIKSDDAEKMAISMRCRFGVLANPRRILRGTMMRMASAIKPTRFGIRRAVSR